MSRDGFEVIVSETTDLDSDDSKRLANAITALRALRLGFDETFDSFEDALRTLVSAEEADAIARAMIADPARMTGIVIQSGTIGGLDPRCLEKHLPRDRRWTRSDMERAVKACQK